MAKAAFALKEISKAQAVFKEGGVFKNYLKSPERLKKWDHFQDNVAKKVGLTDLETQNYKNKFDEMLKKGYPGMDRLEKQFLADSNIENFKDIHKGHQLHSDIAHDEHLRGNLKEVEKEYSFVNKYNGKTYLGRHDIVRMDNTVGEIKSKMEGRDLTSKDKVQTIKAMVDCKLNNNDYVLYHNFSLSEKTNEFIDNQANLNRVNNFYKKY